jgi:hypothetical protein
MDNTHTEWIVWWLNVFSFSILMGFLHDFSNGVETLYVLIGTIAVMFVLCVYTYMPFLNYSLGVSLLMVLGLMCGIGFVAIYRPYKDTFIKLAEPNVSAWMSLPYTLVNHVVLLCGVTYFSLLFLYNLYKWTKRVRFNHFLYASCELYAGLMKLIFMTMFSALFVHRINVLSSTFVTDVPTDVQSRTINGHSIVQAIYNAFNRTMDT